MIRKDYGFIIYTDLPFVIPTPDKKTNKDFVKSFLHVTLGCTFRSIVFKKSIIFREKESPFNSQIYSLCKNLLVFFNFSTKKT